MVSWNRINPSSGGHDRWSKTYVSPQSSVPPQNIKPATHIQTKQTVTSATTVNPQGSNSTKRFPLPKSTSLSNLKHGVSDHISLVTSQSSRPPSPLKISTTLADSIDDILPSFLPHEPTLSKVYGSVLQPKETLTLHSCAVCSIVFPPDATIYPNPNPSQSEEKRFLCRPCFTTSGGSKGICPSCSRPVLTLKAEGGFIHSGGNYWHTRCYNCAACFRNIGDNPMVDLFGRPSCIECFENCLRDPSTPKKNKTSNANSPSTSNPGGLNASYGRKSRENSPALEELEHRLGLVKSGGSRENNPATADHVLSERQGNTLSSSISFSERRLPRMSSAQMEGVFHDSQPGESLQNVFTQRLLSQSPRQAKTNSPTKPLLTSSPHGGSSSRESFHYSNPPSRDGQFKEKTHTPNQTLTEMESSVSNCITKPDISQSLKSSTPVSSFKPSASQQSSSSIGSAYSSMNIETASLCGKCSKPILNSREGGQFITVPGSDENDVPQVYHTDCFKCAVCSRPFNETKKGLCQVPFVKCEAGPAHIQVKARFLLKSADLFCFQCAPAEHSVFQRQTSQKSLQTTSPPFQAPTFTPQGLHSTLSPSTPSEIILQPLDTFHSPPKPRFGGQTACPGCHQSVSVMERGVVPGPQGTRWHASCLICGGRRETTRAQLLGRGREEKGKGCGKKLDSAAKSDREGGVWCRECLVSFCYLNAVRDH